MVRITLKEWTHALCNDLWFEAVGTVELSIVNDLLFTAFTQYVTLFS